VRLEKGDFGTAIYLDEHEFKKLCRPGAGADTCIWAMVGSKGLECGYSNRHPELVRRWKAGETVAKRDGCDVVKAVMKCQKIKSLN